MVSQEMIDRFDRAPDWLIINKPSRKETKLSPETGRKKRRIAKVIPKTGVKKVSVHVSSLEPVFWENGGITITSIRIASMRLKLSISEIVAVMTGVDVETETHQRFRFLTAYEKAALEGLKKKLRNKNPSDRHGLTIKGEGRESLV